MRREAVFEAGAGGPAEPVMDVFFLGADRGCTEKAFAGKGKSAGGVGQPVSVGGIGRPVLGERGLQERRGLLETGHPVGACADRRRPDVESGVCAHTVIRQRPAVVRERPGNDDALMLEKPDGRACSVGAHDCDAVSGR